MKRTFCSSPSTSVAPARSGSRPVHRACYRIVGLFLLQGFVPLMAFGSAAQFSQALNQHLKNQDWNGILTTIEAATDSYQQDPGVRLVQIAALQGIRDFTGCVEACSAYLADFTGTGPHQLDQVYYYRGVCSMRLKGFLSAESDLAKAVRLTSDQRILTQAEPLLRRIEKMKAGFSLGGKTPATPAGLELLARLRKQLLERALKQYFDLHGAYPPALDSLLEGDPPILKQLPLHPLRPEGLYVYQSNGVGYELK